MSRLKNVSKYIHELGFGLGVYLLGARYIHNYCHVYDLFDRYVVKSEYINHAVCSNGNIKYCADTLSILKKFVKDITVPSEVSAFEKEMMFNAGFSDFSHSDKIVEGVSALLDDYAKKTCKTYKQSEGKTRFISELDPAVAFYGILNSGIIWMIYDINRQRLNITQNATEILGYNIFNVYSNDSVLTIFDYVHPDDVQLLKEKLTQSRLSLDISFVDVRIKTGYGETSYKKFNVAIVCSVDDNGSPVRLQITLSPKSE